jgi:ribosome-associated toxin RatA of RatAB toxin-antitoxin module
MARSYYSTVLQQPAERVWAIVRDFNSYSVWIPDATVSQIEGGKSGDTVGAIRDVRVGDRRIRQRLLSHSDRERFISYEFCDPIPYPVRNYEATIRVTPVTDGDHAFVEWWASFDCAADDLDHWTTFYAQSFATWLGSLRAHLDHNAPTPR